MGAYKKEESQGSSSGMSLHAARVLIAAALGEKKYNALRALLDADGVTVVCVENSVQALNEVSSHACTLALVDADLPDTGGLALCRRLTSRAGSIVPTILRLSTDDPAASLAGLEAGALFCLSAAADVHEIYLHLRNQLRTRLSVQPPASPCTRISLGLGQCVLDTLPGAVTIADASQRVVDTNAAFDRLSGFDPQDALQMSIPEVFSPFRFTTDIAPILQKLALDGTWQGELLSQLSEQRTQAFWLYAQAIREKSPEHPGHHIFFLTDIAHHKRREQRLRALAETDALTGVANRNLFLSRLNEAIDRAQAGCESPAILFLDLDRFKEVNDHLGHGRGDQLLREIADILHDCVRASDLIARLGGDEFAVLLIGSADFALAETAQRIVDRLVFTLSGEDGYRIKVTCSIGIAVSPRDGSDSASLLKQADKAMYAVKSRGKQGYCFASEAPESMKT